MDSRRREYIPSMPSTLHSGAGRGAAGAGQAQRAGHRQRWPTSVHRAADRSAGRADQRRRAQRRWRTADALLRTLNDAVQAADLPGLTADLRRTSDAVRDTGAGRADCSKLLANAALAADRLATAAARLPPLIAALQATARRADNGTADVEQGLVPLLRDVQATAANLRETTEALRRYPAQMLLAARRRARRSRRSEARRCEPTPDGLANAVAAAAVLVCCRRQPYVQRRDWPLVVRRANRAAAPRAAACCWCAPCGRRPGWRCAACNGCYRRQRACRFLRAVGGAAGQAVEDDLRQWLADQRAVIPRCWRPAAG